MNNRAPPVGYSHCGGGRKSRGCVSSPYLFIAGNIRALIGRLNLCCL